MDDLLIFSSLVKRYPLNKAQRALEGSRTLNALKGLSFSVREGEIYGLLGPNGAGKTTAMRIAAGLIKSDAGDVLVDGDRVAEDPQKIRRKIGFLSGELKLDEFFTPAYLFDFFSALRDLSKKQTKERRDYLFKHFGIHEYAHQKLAALSSGMKQKVSLVVSIAHDPRIIIFDEPTNGLDLLAARTVRDFLLELKGQGKTIILSTHIFSLAEGICDRVGFIIQGQMLRSGPLDLMRGDMSLEEAFFNLYDNHVTGSAHA
ncbi:MAG: ABC transporter ATP-binding protein [Treponema sp.]|nr:ABC transporter ATP-binding protein [Treponema sp.]